MAGRARVVLSDHKKKLEDRYIDIEGDDGQVIVSVPLPDLWPDQVFALISRDDIIGAAKAIVGSEETYAEFVNAGGSAQLLLSIFKEETGMSVGESPASSSS